MCRTVRIPPRIWNQARFAGLSEKAKLLYLFLWSHPHLTAIGAMRATLPGLAEELGWSLRKCQNAFGELSAFKLVRWCELTYVVWVPGFLEINRPASPEVVASWDELAEVLGEGVLRTELFDTVGRFVAGLGAEFEAALPGLFAPIQQSASVVATHSDEVQAGVVEGACPVIETVSPENDLEAGPAVVEFTGMDDVPAMGDELEESCDVGMSAVPLDSVGIDQWLANIVQPGEVGPTVLLGRPSRPPVSRGCVLCGTS